MVRNKRPIVPEKRKPQQFRTIVSVRFHTLSKIQNWKILLQLASRCTSDEIVCFELREKNRVFSMLQQQL